jgi:hypothetical protein
LFRKIRQYPGIAGFGFLNSMKRRALNGVSVLQGKEKCIM